MRKEPSGFSEGSVSIRPEQEATLTTFGSTLAEGGCGSVALNSSINRDPTEHWVQPMLVTFRVVATTAQRGLAKTEVFGSTRGRLRLDRASGLHERSLEVQRGRMDLGRGPEGLGPERGLWSARRGRRWQHSRGPTRRSDLDGLIRKPLALWRLEPQYGGLFERYLE